jgi:hypothetical protein
MREKEHQRKSATEISKLLGEKWRSFSDGEKEEYTNMAEQVGEPFESR